MAEFLKGRGYVFQGQWLGTDTSAFNEVEIRRDDVSLVERQETHASVHMRNGTIVILFDMTIVTEPVVIDATAVPTFKSQSSRNALPSGKKKGK